MSNRPALLLIAGLCLFIFFMGWLVDENSSSRGAVKQTRAAEHAKLASTTSSASFDPAMVRAVGANEEGRFLLPEAAALSRTLNAPGSTAEEDVQTLATLIDLYRRANDGAIPAGGLNEEITEQLTGGNFRRFAVLPPDCVALDAAGRLVDRWGKPYFLHPLSRELLEIRSAGPDGVFGTNDDVTAKSAAGAEIRR